MSKTKPKPVRDPDLIGAQAAMRRAGAAARRIAKATNTPLVLWEDGKIVKKWLT